MRPAVSGSFGGDAHRGARSTCFQTTGGSSGGQGPLCRASYANGREEALPLRLALQLKQSPGLPIAFDGGGGEAGGLRGVHDRAEGVAGGVGCRSSVAGGTGCSAGSIVAAVACGGMGGKRCLARDADPYLAAGLGASRLDGQAGPVVLGAMLLD